MKTPKRHQLRRSGAFTNNFSPFSIVSIVDFKQVNLCWEPPYLKAAYLQAEACNFTKSKTPPWVFFTFFKLKQMVPNRAKHHI